MRLIKNAHTSYNHGLVDLIQRIGQEAFDLPRSVRPYGFQANPQKSRFRDRVVNLFY